MLEKVKQYALEKYAGDESAAEQFVQGFVKEAMADPANKVMGAGGGGSRALKGIMGSMKEGLGAQIGKGAGALLLSTGVAATVHGMNQVQRNNLHTKFLQSLEQAIASNRLLREADRAKVKQYGDTVFRFAPNVASDVNLLTNVLTYAIQGESIDVMMIKTLTELENRYTSNTGVVGSIKSFL